MFFHRILPCLSYQLPVQCATVLIAAAFRILSHSHHVEKKEEEIEGT